MRTFLTSFAVTLLMLTGCASTTPPTAVERALYDIGTNITPSVVTVTNSITLTNTTISVVPVFLTNIFNQIVPTNVTITNFQTVQVPVFATNLVLTTNYSFNPNSTSTNAGTVVGEVVNAAFPGLGSLAATALTGLVGLWGVFRTRQKGQAISGELAQIIETARSVIKSAPNGSALGTQFDTFLVQHQADVNLLSEIGDIVAKEVDPATAQASATGILTAASATPAVAVVAAHPSA